MSPSLDVIRRTERADPIDDRKLRAQIVAGSWTKIAPGAFVQTAQWSTLKAHEQHRARVEEVTRRMRGPAVLSHFAAAALWSIDVLGSWPARIDVSRPQARGGRSTGWIRRPASHTVSALFLCIRATYQWRACGKQARVGEWMPETGAVVRTGRRRRHQIYQLTGSALPSS